MGNREIEAIVREVLKTAADSQAVGITGDAARQGSGGKTLAGLVHVSMPLALAVKLIEKIEAKAAEWDMRVVTAVSDASARPVAIHCMDGAYIGSYDVALNKTYTSIAFRCPLHSWAH